MGNGEQNSETALLERFHPVWIPAEETGAPVLILLHGTGGDERQMVGFAREILEGRQANLLGLRGQELERGHVTRWFRRLSEGRFETRSVIERSGELAEVLKQAGEEYGFDPGEAVALGYSNGANIAAAMMLLHPKALAGAVLVRTMLPLRPETMPDLTGHHALLLSGRQDPFGPHESALELASLLRESGAEVEHPVLEAGHEVREEDLLIIRSWLGRFFPRGEEGDT